MSQSILSLIDLCLGMINKSVCPNLDDIRKLLAKLSRKHKFILNFMQIPLYSVQKEA